MRLVGWAALYQPNTQRQDKCKSGQFAESIYNMDTGIFTNVGLVKRSPTYEAQPNLKNG